MASGGATNTAIVCIAPFNHRVHLHNVPRAVMPSSGPQNAVKIAHAELYRRCRKIVVARHFR